MTDEYRTYVTALFTNPSYFDLYKFGCLRAITLDDWLGAAERLFAVCTPEHGCTVEGLKDISSWLLPLYSHYVHENLSPTGVVDLGCGVGVTLWDAAGHGCADLVGIDLDATPPYLPPQATYFGCNMLDLRQMRRAADRSIHRGGTLCCTEVLEHLEFSPLPPLLLLTETVRPDYIYLTAPTFGFPGGFLRPWQHYKDLPCWRGQPVRHPTPHTKPWTFAELADLIDELGFDLDGGWWAAWRVGIVGRRGPA
jgi:hypothetical protein